MKRDLAKSLAAIFRGTIQKKLGGLPADDGGGVLIFVVLVLSVLMGFAALAVDVSLWYGERRLGQSIVDAAVIDGALELGRTGTQASILIAANAAAVQNGYDPTEGDTLTINWPPLSGPFAGDNNYVEGIYTTPGPIFFSRFFLSGDFDVAARAVATVTNGGSGCIYALSTEVKVGYKTGIRVHGTADVNLDCEVYSNTPFDQYGSSCFVSTGIYAVGEATGVCITPEKPVIMSEPVVDPLGYIDEPSYTGCTYPGGVTVGNGEDVYLDPGTYCGDFDVHGTAHLNPGLYFIHGGSLKFNAQSEVYGDGVTFFMDIGKKGQDFTINGGSYVDLSAPVDASVTGYEQLIGILFFQARDTLSDKEVHEFNGGAEMYLDGAIYTAGAQVEFNGGSIIGPSKTLIIADSVDIGGTSQFGSMYNSTVAFNPAFVGSRLVE